MELIRCDQCKAELDKLSRHYTVEIRGMLRPAFDWSETVHLCSESCGAAWFSERAPTVASASE